MPLRDEFPETDTLSQGLTSIAKAGRGLFAKSLAVQMQDTLATLARKDKALRIEKDNAEAMSEMYDADNKELTAFLKAYASGLITLPEDMMAADSGTETGETEDFEHEE